MRNSERTEDQSGMQTCGMSRKDRKRLNTKKWKEAQVALGDMYVKRTSFGFMCFIPQDVLRALKNIFLELGVSDVGASLVE